MNLLREYIRNLLLEQEEERSDEDKIITLFLDNGANGLHMAQMILDEKNPARVDMENLMADIKKSVKIYEDIIDGRVDKYSSASQELSGFYDRMKSSAVKASAGFPDQSKAKGSKHLFAPGIASESHYSILAGNPLDQWRVLFDGAIEMMNQVHVTPVIPWDPSDSAGIDSLKKWAGI